MIIENFLHEIDDGGWTESIRLTLRDPGLAARAGIRADQMPATFVVAMRAYLTGTVVEPVEWQMIDMTWDMVFGRGQGEIELGFRRMAPSVVGPHDGNGWWRHYWPKVQQAKVAIEMFRQVGQ